MSEASAGHVGVVHSHEAAAGVVVAVHPLILFRAGRRPHSSILPVHEVGTAGVVPPTAQVRQAAPWEVGTALEHVMHALVRQSPGDVVPSRLGQASRGVVDQWPRPARRRGRGLRGWPWSVPADHAGRSARVEQPGAAAGAGEERARAVGGREA